MSAGGVATIEITIGDLSVRIMGEAVESDRNLTVVGVHVSSTGMRPNDFGIGNLTLAPKAVSERFGYDEALIEKAVRTAGARPGHRPRRIRVAGNGDFAAEPGIAPDAIG
jgi:hypothetical protein